MYKFNNKNLIQQLKWMQEIMYLKVKRLNRLICKDHRPIGCIQQLKHTRLHSEEMEPRNQEHIRLETRHNISKV